MYMLTDGTMFNEWVNVTGDSLRGLWQTVLGFLPNLIGALIIFIIGLIIASLVEKLVERVIFYLKVDTLLRKAEIEGYLERANMKLNAGKFMGKLAYWFLLVVFLRSASSQLGLTAFSDFFGDVFSFIPAVITAALIMLITLIAANFVRGLVIASVSSAKLGHARGLGVFVWWVIFFFGLVMALPKIGVNTAIIQTLITGLIAMLALAGGLAFGLGGRDRAARFIEHWGDQMKH